MEWLQEKGIAIARGNADAVQGRYRLSGDVLTAHMSEAEGSGFGEIRRLDAAGNVTLSTPEETVTGDAGTYDVDKGIAVLVGAVVLTQGDSVMRGERLVMDLVTGRSTLEGVPGSPASAGQPGGGRVRACIGEAMIYCRVPPRPGLTGCPEGLMAAARCARRQREHAHGQRIARTGQLVDRQER